MSVKKTAKKPSLRKVEILTGVNKHAEGSALIKMGDTHVLCTASVEKRVPEWLRGQGRGWVTAEYGMLPRATHTRNRRERDKTPSRSLEIGRLIGRSLRASLDLNKMEECMITVDCDVLQADGGTRTASITGGMVALALALRNTGMRPPRSLVAAVSVGIVDDEYVLDLDYEADHRADMDMNVAMTARGEFVEVQASAEGMPVAPHRLQRLEALAASGIRKLIAMQKKALADAR